MSKIDKPQRPKIRVKPEIVFKLPKFNLFGVMNSISNYKLFRFLMIVLGIVGWILYLI